MSWISDILTSWSGGGLSDTVSAPAEVSLGDGLAATETTGGIELALDAGSQLPSATAGQLPVYSGSVWEADNLRDIVHSAISSTEQTIDSAASPAYIPLQISDTDTTLLLSELGITGMVGATCNVVGYRVHWRDDSTGSDIYVDDITIAVAVRYLSTASYKARCSQVGSTNVVSEGATNTAVTLTVLGGTGASYEVTVTPDSDAAHTIGIAMLQDASTARKVTTEMWHGTMRTIG